MVALASPAATGLAEPGHARRGDGVAWSLAAGGVLVLGLGLRLVLGGWGVGDRSATVMAALLTVGAWLGAVVLSSPRTAFFVTLGLLALLDVAALPVRNAPEYDYREAFFRTDQVIAATAPAAPGSLASPVLVLLVEPVFPAGVAQPRFGLAGEVGAAELAWDCSFQRGLQHVALALPPVAAASSGPLDVRLHLTGSPTRETDYLLVYASARQGGFLASLVAAADLQPSTTRCRLTP